MTEEQADRLIELLSDIKDQIDGLSERISSVEEKFEAFDDLSELARNITRGGLFTGSFAGQIGEDFNAGVKESLDTISESLGSKLDEVVSKLDEVNSSIRSNSTD